MGLSDESTVKVQVGGRRATIFRLAVPMMVGLLLMNVLNLIDMAMVGGLGDATLAAAGIGSYLFLLSGSAFIGLSTAVQALVARAYGRQEQSELAVPLRAAHVIVVLSAVPWSGLQILLAPTLVWMLAPEPQVAELAAQFFVYRCLGIAGFGLCLAHVGYLNGRHRPARFVAVASLVVIINTALNGLLIHGRLGFPRMGLSGAGLASTLALYLGLVVYTLAALARDRAYGAVIQAPRWREQRVLMELAAPLCIERMIYLLGVAAFLAVLGRLSVRELAVGNVLLNLLAMARLMQASFGMASVSLIGTALAAHGGAEARRWGWDVVRAAVLSMFLLGLVVGSGADHVLAVFIEDPATLTIARVPLLITCFTLWIDSIGIVLEQALAAVGRGPKVLLFGTSLHWFVFLPGAYLVGPHLGFGLTGIWCVQVAYRLLHTAILSGLWSRFDAALPASRLSAPLQVAR